MRIAVFSNGTDLFMENATDGDTSDLGVNEIPVMDFYPEAVGLLGTIQPLKPRDGTDNIYDLGTVMQGLPGTHFFLCWSGELAGELTPIGSVQLAGPQDNQERHFFQNVFWGVPVTSLRECSNLRIIVEKDIGVRSLDSLYRLN